MQRILLLAAVCCSAARAMVVTGTTSEVNKRDVASNQCSYEARAPHAVAQKYGKYFGTATAVGQWWEKSYTDILDNNEIFGWVIPSISMKVRQCLARERKQIDFFDSGTTLSHSTAGLTSLMPTPLPIELATMVKNFAVMH